MAPDSWKNTIDINLTGLWHTARAAVPHLIAGGQGGSIVLTSSVAGLQAMPGMSGYVSAKHGVIGLMRTLALELGQHHIRVNSVLPTNVNTPMFMNEGAFKLFRPDLENPGPDDVAAVIAQFMHVLPHRLGRAGGHQQRDPLPGLRRGPLHHRRAPARRR